MSTSDPGDLPPDTEAPTRAPACGDVRAVEVVTEQLQRLRIVHDATNCVAAWNEDALPTAARLGRA